MLASAEAMKHPRPFVQRNFIEWLEMNRQHFISAPRITRRTVRVIEFEFVGLTSMLSGVQVRDGGLSVAVMYDGVCWDLIVDIGLAESRSKHGYTNLFYLPEMRKYYPDRQALWVGEVFQPFLEWCNATLAQANWLALYGTDGGSTWAKLRNESDPAAMCFPVQTPNLLMN